jgi:hypothetical protein
VQRRNARYPSTSSLCETTPSATCPGIYPVARGDNVHLTHEAALVSQVGRQQRDRHTQDRGEIGFIDNNVTGLSVLAVADRCAV